MSNLFERARGDQRFLAVLVALWGLIIIGALIVVVMVFFGGDDSAAPVATDMAATPEPTLVLGGVTVVAASPASGDGGEPAANTPVPNPDTGTQTPIIAPQSADEPLPPFPSDSFGYGIQVQGSVGDPKHTIGSVQKLGMNWIKQQVRWEHIEPAPGEFNWALIDGVIDEADRAGVYVMLSVVTAPEWTRTNSGGGTHGPPDDYNEFGRFIGQLVDRYINKIHAIEVWNEQNLDREWRSPNGLNAADYVRLLKITYDQIKARDPNIIVISGALSPTGGWVESDGRVTAVDDFVYFQELLNAGLLDYAECVGAHHNGINFPPDKEWDEGYDDPTAAFRGPFENPHHSWSFKSTLWGYYNMMNGMRKLCVTEFGWATTEGFDGVPPGFEFATDNTLEEQAEWIVQAFELQREWDITWVAYLWNLNYANTSQNAQDPNVPYSIVDFNGVPRPAYDALEHMPKP
jgi:hypothetical protein